MLLVALVVYNFQDRGVDEDCIVSRSLSFLVHLIRPPLVETHLLVHFSTHELALKITLATLFMELVTHRLSDLERNID